MCTAKTLLLQSAHKELFTANKQAVLPFYSPLNPKEEKTKQLFKEITEEDKKIKSNETSVTSQGIPRDFASD